MKKLFCDVCGKEVTTLYKVQIHQHESTENNYTNSSILDQEICMDCIKNITDFVEKVDKKDPCGCCTCKNCWGDEKDCEKATLSEEDFVSSIDLAATTPIQVSPSEDCYTVFFEVKDDEKPQDMIAHEVEICRGDGTTEKINGPIAFDFEEFKKNVEKGINDISSKDNMKKVSNSKPERNNEEDKINELIGIFNSLFGTQMSKQDIHKLTDIWS